ncbi:cytochrome b-c1 complex subunit 10 [Myxozyma melibiosi]|uniref:Cytochrome b-c1 complex subunit 10 n=1 Tax=Myxozyma melibiosi TaxID=54550 RepID=A0ABR1FCM4_9ASCO
MAMRITLKPTPTILGFPPSTLIRWTPILGFWGAAAGAGALFLLEPIPRVRNDILSKIPVLGNYWVRPVDPADSPF